MTTTPVFPGTTFSYYSDAAVPRPRSGDTIFAVVPLASTATASAGDTLDTASGLADGADLLAKVGTTPSSLSLADLLDSVDDRVIVRVLDTTPTNAEAVAALGVLGADGSLPTPTVIMAPGLTAGGSTGGDRADDGKDGGESSVFGAMKALAQATGAVAMGDAALEATAADAGQRANHAAAITAAKAWWANNHGRQAMCCAGPGWDGTNIIPPSGTVAGALLSRSAQRGRAYGVHYAPVSHGAERYYGFSVGRGPTDSSDARSLLEGYITVALQSPGRGRYTLGHRLGASGDYGSTGDSPFLSIWSVQRVVQHAEEIATEAGRDLLGSDSGPVGSRGLAAVIQEALQPLVTGAQPELRHALVEVEAGEPTQHLEGGANLFLALGIINPLVTIRTAVRLESI